MNRRSKKNGSQTFINAMLYEGRYLENKSWSKNVKPAFV